MLQYLMNVTAIWLLSLAIFDLFLRRESYHGYNRAYLLSTLILGLLLPLYDGGEQIMNYGAAVAEPVYLAAQQADNIAKATINNNAGSPSFNWVLAVYALGACISILLLLKEVWLIRKLYVQGRKSKDGVWTIVETGKNTSPFSAFRYIFLSSKSNYDETQLHMILQHEEQHGHLLHFIDLLVLQLVRVAFWFHPLVYIYGKRLQMVHEYQADNRVEKQADVYGHFLIEQAMLQPAPSLTHSFNRSPIKNRVTMLTHTSSALARGKKIVIVPMVLCCLLFFTQKSFSETVRKEGNKIYYKGNVFEMWSPHAGPDTIMLEDPVTGEMIMKITMVDTVPVKMNGVDVYTVQEMSKSERDAAKLTELDVQAYYITKIREYLSPLNDGIYNLRGSIVLNEDGDVVYHQGFKLYKMSGGVKPPEITEADKKMMEEASQKIVKLISDTRASFKPVHRGGQPVVYRITDTYVNSFTVKDHNAF
jgi:hypothetical protein